MAKDYGANPNLADFPGRDSFDGLIEEGRSRQLTPHENYGAIGNGRAVFI